MRHRRADGSVADAVPAGVDVRTMVHEYGGAAWTVAEGTLYYSDVHDGRLYRIGPGGRPEPLTVPGRLRYADLEIDASRRRLIGVGEDHSGGGEAVNRLVAVALDGAVRWRRSRSWRGPTSTPRRASRPTGAAWPG